MPDFEVDGKRYHVPFMSILHPFGSTTDWFTCNSQVRVRAKPIKVQPVLQTPRWSQREDKLLQKMRNHCVPWKDVSLAFDDRPVPDIKERWAYLERTKRKDRRNLHLRKGKGVDDDSSSDNMSEDNSGKQKSEQHVSFSEVLDDDTDHSSNSDDTEDDKDSEDSDSLSERSKCRRALYIDEDFSLKDFLLLHDIAAKWKQDRWTAISQAWSEKTGRTMNPEQAKSMLKEHRVEQTDGWGGGSG